MLTDPLFYLVSIPGVMLYGVAKGGFGGPMAILAVPLMAMVMSPAQAAAILLPILVVMDVLVVRTYWGVFDREAVIRLIPFGLLGTVLGYLTVGAFNDDYMRILVGVMALIFGLQTLWGGVPRSGHKPHSWKAGSVLGTLTGFTSFSIHAGAPPIAMYLMPRGLSPLLFAGTCGIVFAVINASKLLPYYALGQFSSQNLGSSLILAPLAPLGVKLGHYLVKHSRPRMYYGVISFFLVVLGVRLIWQGAMALQSGG